MKTQLLVGTIPKRTRRQARLIKRERRQPHRTLLVGSRVALGHGKGTRLGRIVAFVHDLGMVEARVEWDNPRRLTDHAPLTTVVRLDALRQPTRKDRRRK